MNVPLMSELIPASLKKGISENKLNQILVLLTKRERLYNIDGNYIYKDIVNKSRETLIKFLNETNNGITVAQFRDLVNGNRKMCLLLLAQYDREGITHRVGDVRFITEKEKSRKEI